MVSDISKNALHGSIFKEMSNEGIRFHAGLKKVKC